MHRLKFFAAVLGSSTFLVPAAFAQTATPAPDGGGLSEIVVTAQKREQNLQDVPIAITALNSQAIANARATSIANLSGVAPNVTVNDQGDPSAPAITIRGIGCCATLNAVDPKVGIYIDGVYIGRATGGLFDLADIERVEILRGPQGTLFGRNATAGAMSLITREPTGKLGIKQDLSYGNYNAFRSRTTINLPAWGPLSVSATYLHDQVDGYARNGLGGMTIDFGPATGGRYGKLTAAKRLGGHNTDAVRIAARLEATDDLTVDYKFDYTDSNATPEPSQVLGLGDAGAASPDLAGLILGQSLLGGHNNIFTPANKASNTVYNFSTNQHLQVGGHSLTLNWKANDTVTLKSITAYRWYKLDPNAFDLAATGGMVVPDGMGGTIPFATLLSVRQSKQHQFSQELQLNISTDHLEFVAGGFYFKERAPAYDPLFGFSLAGAPQLFPGNVAYTAGSGITNSISKNESKAVYAQATYHVTDQLDVTGGIRATWDNRFVNISSLQFTNTNVGLGEHTSNFSHVDYTAVLTYKPTRDITAYAKIATGYVSGGIVAGQSFEPETLKNYEIGIKSELFDRRLRANIDAYYMDYRNLQVQTFGANGLVYDNAGKAKVKGVEAEFEAVPVDKLTLGMNLGYQQFIYKTYVTGGVDIGETGLDIARPRDTPKWNLKLSADYRFPEFGNGAEPFARIDARYRSKAFANITPVGVASTEAVTNIDPYWIVDGRVGVRSFDLGRIKASASVWAMNMFNSRKILFANNLSTVVAATFVHPRTYGMDLSIDF
ncbi:TonB-dependent receptor [Flavisphingomonas formosensis]|uniref:TonB-dependent receptor n=1 Tax=Flavisphingomonas formosensis TaxID=861534 RepID=UPI0012FACDD1|nr:TonB-dependent receptor [Sphingomonas formosensis]